MASLFISWASPDRPEVEIIRRKLRSAGVDFWISSDGMGYGDIIRERVYAEIEACQIALFLLSNAAAVRPWVLDELAACDYARKQIIPVRIKALDAANIPPIFTQRQMQIGDLMGLNVDAQFNELVRTIFQRLEIREPIRLQGALVAMTSGQYVNLRAADETWQALQDLCGRLGMRTEALLDELGERYGADVDGFKPFRTPGDPAAPDKTLMELMDQVLELANRKRRLLGRKRILLQWRHHDFAAAQGAGLQELITRWREWPSFIVVDSVSLLHREVRQSLEALPAADDVTRSAMLWIPPYTRHSSALETLIEQATRAIQVVGAACTDYRVVNERFPKRWVNFDCGMPATLANWLYRMVDAQKETQDGNEESLREMTRTRPPTMTTPYG